MCGVSKKVQNLVVAGSLESGTIFLYSCESVRETEVLISVQN